MTDLKSVSLDATRGIDRVINDTGYVDDDTLQTAVMLSLFTDARSDESDDLEDGADPRGVWSDSVIGTFRPTGSKRWLLRRSKQNNETLLKLIDYDTEALQWMIDSNLVSDIKISAKWSGLGLLEQRISLKTITTELEINIKAPGDTTI